MKKIIPILISISISIILLVGCSAGKNYGSSEKLTETSIETTTTATIQTTVTTEMTTVTTTASKVYAEKSLYYIMLTLPQNPPVGKLATQMSETEVLSVGNTVANNFKNICYKYFSDHWFEYVKNETNTDGNIDFSNICELDEYASLYDFAISVNDCMTADAINKAISKNGFYVEINNQIYCNDITYGWPFGSECRLSSYQIIDDNTIKFIFNVDEDPNAEAHQCSFIAQNIGGWKVSDIDIDTSRTIIHQYVSE